MQPHSATKNSNILHKKKLLLLILPFVTRRNVVHRFFFDFFFRFFFFVCLKCANCADLLVKLKCSMQENRSDFCWKKKTPKILVNWTMRKWPLSNGVRLTSNDFAIDIMPNFHHIDSIFGADFFIHQPNCLAKYDYNTLLGFCCRLGKLVFALCR